MYRNYPANFLKRLRKTIKTSLKIAGSLAKTQTGYLPNTSLDSNYYINLLGHLDN
jgi:hypothetical protein